MYRTCCPPIRKKVSFKQGKGVQNVTSNCMGRAVHQLEKEASFRLGTGVEYVSLNCKGRAIRQFEKEVSFRLATGEVLSH